MTSATQEALFLTSKGGEFAVRSTSVYSPGVDQVLARVNATGLNPVEWKIKDHLHDWPRVVYPAILGTDGAGVVDEVSRRRRHQPQEGRSDVRALSAPQPSVWEGLYTNELATYQQYALVFADLASKIPDNVTEDEAASLPMTIATACLGMYNKNKDGQHGGGAERTPFWKSSTRYAGQPFIVLGGATSIGQFAIQFARLSSFSPIIVTASEKYTDWLKSLGATHILPRSLSAAAVRAEVERLTTQPISIVYDTVGSTDTQKTGWSLLAPGGQMILVAAEPVEGIEHKKDGKEIVSVFGNVHAGQQDAGRELFARLGQLLENGSIKPNRVQVLPHGLAGIPDGLELLGPDKVSGVKLIAHPHESA
ncbi:NAD(P)-binding protein [Punctularia strigosozonata HHB-11173 SS5]|uniref:NAD(P)-binding protein n=1 Tax=Punctularia strigosozonata (strain HHB-11173) TaxID=741275 RepID=UPI0004417E74|nr:NAD(P)-binding protein [Punctularia strigosozonata HHB-11173 SS5]EIN12415.1 NAD(P)-binding protein [Punctularia strigosozonata HHB-11173 SS5]